MSQRKPKKPVPARTRPEPTAELRQALRRQRKAELVDTLLELAQADRQVLRQLMTRFNVAAAPDELVAATQQAIADATDFDERDINRNFEYDYEAYGAVKRNLGRLIDAGQLRLAMELALELMRQGSYQVEMSDEGLMTVKRQLFFLVDDILISLRRSCLPGRQRQLAFPLGRGLRVPRGERHPQPTAVPPSLLRG